MNKYGAKKTVYNGITFDSKKEAQYCAKLDILKKSTHKENRVFDYELQVRYDIIVNDKKIGFYKLDFMVQYADGKIRYIDIKGCKKGAGYQLFRLKKKLVEALYNIKIEEL